MTSEESLIQKLVGIFKYLEGKCTVSRQKRINIEASGDCLLEILEYLSSKLSFSMLCIITGLDLGDEIQLLYHLANDTGIILNLKIKILKANPVIETVSGIYHGAALYEGELINSFGIKVKGILPENRYSMPESWLKELYDGYVKNGGG